MGRVVSVYIYIKKSLHIQKTCYMCIHTYVYMFKLHVYMSVYICIYRQRERESMSIFLCLKICILIWCLCIQPCTCISTSKRRCFISSRCFHTSRCRMILGFEARTVHKSRPTLCSRRRARRHLCRSSRRTQAFQACRSDKLKNSKPTTLKSPKIRGHLRRCYFRNPSAQDSREPQSPGLRIPQALRVSKAWTLKLASSQDFGTKGLTSERSQCEACPVSSNP